MRTAVFFPLLVSVVTWGQAPTIQLADQVNLRNAAVSHDGTDVFFVAGRNPQADPVGNNLYRTQLFGSSKFTTRLTNYKADTLFSGVSAVAYPGTGSRVAYSYVRDNLAGEEEVHVLDTNSGVDQLLVTDRDGCPRILCVNCYSTCLRTVHLSPDGGTILYSTARTQPFYTVKSDGTGLKRLSAYEGTLAPSGQRVISQTGRIVFTASAPFGPTFAPAPTDVYIMNLDGTNAQAVTHFSSVTSVATHAVISANGDWIAFALSEPSGTQVYLVRPDGTGLRRLSSGTADAANPSISADGSVVSYVQDGQVKQVTSANAPAAVTRFTLSSAKASLTSGDGRRIGVLLGPPSGFAAGIYLASPNATSSYAQLFRLFTPRLLFSNGIVSAGGTAPPSVGSLITAYGVNLSNEEITVAQQFPLPTVLDGISLLNDTVPLPVQAVTPWQVNAHLPQTPVPGTIALRIKDADGVWPDARTLALARAPEAIPMVGVGSGPLLAAAVYPGTKTLADGAHPAAAGDVLEVYSLGLGLTTPRVEAGVASPFATADVKPRVRIGSIEADVSFAGLVPGLAGVYQVNLKVPAGLSPGYQPLRWINSDGIVSGTSGIHVR